MDWFGTRTKLRQKDVLDPGQKALLGQLEGGLGGQGGGLEGVLSYLTQLLQGGGQSFENFAAPHRQRFEEETIPMLEERYAGAGGGMGGALSSSGFGQAIGGAARGFESDLSNLYEGSRQNAAQQIMALLQQTLGTQPFMYTERPGSPGIFANMLGQFAKGAGQSAGQGIGEGVKTAASFFMGG
jgi:hypothetical protein